MGSTCLPRKFRATDERVDLIQTVIAPDSWDEVGGAGSRAPNDLRYPGRCNPEMLPL